MAIRPDWTVGTLTLVAGSKNFTTIGSALESAALQAGDAIITVTGYVLIIEAITGQNSGVLYSECPVAAAGANQPLRIRYQPDGSRVQGAMRMVRELLTSGNLEAFAALVGEEDAVPVFVGPGVIKLVSKTEFGPDDTKGNLAAFAELVNIANLTELAALTKANEQFIVMGADGQITILPIKEITDEIATNKTEIDKKFQLPEGGTEQQLLSGTGDLIDAESLPVSTAMKTALDSKASYNWIINGDFIINQRGGVKKPANGVYGFDRWKGHANGIEQIIEALPAGEYTLTWSGGGNGTFGGQTKASPIKAIVAGGNTSVVVPQTATKVSVVSGDATAQDLWQARMIADELPLCQRYYEIGRFRLNTFSNYGTRINKSFMVEKRSTPSVGVTITEVQAVTGGGVEAITPTGFNGGGTWVQSGTGAYGAIAFDWKADAEI